MELYKFFFEGIASDLANYLGLFLTIIGFGVTLFEIAKSRKATEEARKAVDKVRIDIKRIDTVNDLSSAISIIEEIKTLQRECSWYLLPDRYSTLKKLIISVKTSYPYLNTNQKITLQKALQNITDIDRNIEIALKKKSEPANVPRINTILSEEKDGVYEMLVELRNSIGA